jgi:signal peptidase II
MSQPRRSRLLWLALAFAALIVFLDQLVKDILIAHLTPGHSTPFLGDFVKLYLTYNDSAAFSMGFGQTWFFALLSTFASLALLWYLPKLKTASWLIMGGIALGGIVGNLVDRLIREPGFGVGHVVDYIQIPFNFPIFNLADSAIVSIAILTVIRILLGHKIGEPNPKKTK